MNNYLITCESTADLSEALLAARGIPYACFTFHMDGQDYADDYGRSMPYAVFYEKMKAGSVSTTSQVSTGAYDALWRPYLKTGKDILHLSLSSGISGSYNGACLAAEALREEFPERKLIVVDSLNASSGYGLLVELAADKRDEGASIEALQVYLLAVRNRVNAWFYTSDLTYLCRGGRVSKTAFVLGSALKICPLMRVDGNGKLVPAAKYHGKRRATQACADKLFALAEGGTAYDAYCYISHSNCRQDAELLAEMIAARCPQLAEKIKLFDIGTVIGSHTGPGTVALFFFGEERP